MNAMFAEMASEIGQLLLLYAGPDGKIPESRILDLQKLIRPIVSRRFVGGVDRRPFDDQHRPQAEFPSIIAAGQLEMIDLAMSRSAKILERHLPDDLRQQLAALYQQWSREPRL